jgi:hypothetical protein
MEAGADPKRPRGCAASRVVEKRVLTYLPEEV